MFLLEVVVRRWGDHDVVRKDFGVTWYVYVCWITCAHVHVESEGLWGRFGVWGTFGVGLENFLQKYNADEIQLTAT